MNGRIESEGINSKAAEKQKISQYIKNGYIAAWLYVLAMSRTRFRMNPTGLEPRTT